MRGEVDQSTEHRINVTLPANVQTGCYATSNAHKGAFFATSECSNVPIILRLPQTFYYPGKAIAEEPQSDPNQSGFYHFAPCR
jgi:hypothetical protein